jgi:hypothetical protein
MEIYDERWYLRVLQLFTKRASQTCRSEKRTKAIRYEDVMICFEIGQEQMWSRRYSKLLTDSLESPFRTRQKIPAMQVFDG